MMRSLALACLVTFAAPVAAQEVHPVDGTPLAADQSFSYAIPAQFPSLDPQLIQGVIASQIANQIYEPLVRQAPDGSPASGVAARWTSEADRVWTFELRDDARWSNGDPVTAEDFAHAWRRAADPATGSPYAWYVELAAIENAAAVIAGDAPTDALGVEVLDAHTLRVTLDRPVAHLPGMLSYATFMPVHRPTLAAHGDGWTAPETFVGNGPYMLDEVALSESFRLVPNPNWHGAGDVIVDEVTGHVVPEAEQAVLRWEAGEFDMVETLPPGRFPELAAAYPDAAHATPRLCSYYFEPNLVEGRAPPALGDARVRRALSYAIDRDVIVDRFLRGGETPAYVVTHVGTSGFVPPRIDYATWTQAERTAQAVVLLEEAGIGPDAPLRFTVTYPDLASVRDVLTIVQQMWRPLGVQVTLQNYEWQSFLARTNAGDFEMAGAGWCADYDEPSTFLELLTTGNTYNRGGYSNPEIDRLMAEARLAEDKAPFYTEVERIAAEDMPLIPLWHDVKTFLLDPSIRGWPFENAEDVWYIDRLYRAAEPSQ